MLSPLWIPVGFIMFVIHRINEYSKDIRVNDDSKDTFEPRAGKTLGL